MANGSLPSAMVERIASSALLQFAQQQPSSGAQKYTTKFPLLNVEQSAKSFIPKVYEDDLVFKDEAVLLELFLETLKDLDGEEIAEQVKKCYTMAATYAETSNVADLDALVEFIDDLPPSDGILLASAFSHMLNLENLAEEVQMVLRRRATTRTGSIADEGSALTESTFAETLDKLVRLGKSKEEIFESLKSQSVDLVLTAHPTQSVRRSILRKHAKIKTTLLRLHEGGSILRPNDKKELIEELHRQIQAAWRTDEIRRVQPTPQDEMRAGMSYLTDTVWNCVPRFLRRVDTALRSIGINERLPYSCKILEFSSWMGGDRDGNPNVTASVTRDVCLLSRLMAANLYYSQIESLMFELSMWRCSAELRSRVESLMREGSRRESVKHYREFWKLVPGMEPYRVILGTVRDRLFNTRERLMHLLQTGISPIPQSDTFTSAEQLMEPLEVCYRSLHETGDHTIADGSLLDFMRQVTCFGLTLVRLDIRQEADRHTEALDAITTYLGFGSYREWSEDQRQEFLVRELRGKRPLFGPDLVHNTEVKEVLDTCRVLAELPADSFGGYVISMSTVPSDVLAVHLLMRECGVKTPLRVVPLYERLQDLNNAPANMERLFSIDWYRNLINGKQEVMIGYSDSGKDAGRLSAAWALFQAQANIVKVAEKFGVKVTLFHGRGGTIGRGGGPTHLAILSQPPGTVNGSLRVTIQGEIIEHSFGEEQLSFRTLERFTSATLEVSLHTPTPPKPEWQKLMEEMSAVATEDFRGVLRDKRFLPYFQAGTPVLEYGRMNIGSRPSKRRSDLGIESLRAIPWVFAWTQTRIHLPVWLGVGAALKYAIEKDPANLDILRRMHSEWPFFRVTLDLVEMVFAKGDPRIASMYDKILVPDELRSLGEEILHNYHLTRDLLLQVAGHSLTLDNNPALKQRIILREPLTTPLNVQQALTLKKMRSWSFNHSGNEGEGERSGVVQLNADTSYAPGLEDTLILTMKGIAAGMQNTG